MRPDLLPAKFIPAAEKSVFLAAAINPVRLIGLQLR